MTWWTRLWDRLFPRPITVGDVIAALPAPAGRGALKIQPEGAGSPGGLLTPLGGRPMFTSLRETFRLPEPPPGVPGDAKVAMDEAWGASYDWLAGQPGASQWAEGMGFMGYPYLAELTQRPEYRRISEIIAKEMTRKWIVLTAGGDESKQERIDKMNAAIARLKLREAFRHATELDGFFGRSHIFPDLGIADPTELRTLLVIDPRTIKKGSLKAFRVIEPIWTYPNAYDTSNPLSPSYFNPTTWFVQATLVHSTRLLTFVGRQMPDLLKPAYAFGGLSLSQMAKPYVDNWLRTRQSVSDLIHSFSIVVLKTNMSAFLEGGAAEDIFKRVFFFNATRDNRGSHVVDKDTEEVENIAVPLSTLDALQAQAQEQMAAVSGIPLVILLGITPSGLNASSDGEIRVFYGWINSQQEDQYRDPLKRALDIIQLSEFGDIDEDITFKFVPLWQLDDAGRATVNKTKADTAAVYIESGVLDPDDERERLASDPESDYAGLDLSGPAPGLPEEDGLHESVTGDPAKGAESRSAERSGA